LKRVGVTVWLAVMLAVATDVAQAASGFALARQEDYVIRQGAQIRLRYFYAVDPTCKSRGLPRVTLVGGASGGTFSVRTESRFPTYQPDNDRYHCNKLRTSTTVVYFRPVHATGKPAVITYVVRFPSGVRWRETARIRVLAP
jgi:hypothetical protein